jgi:hypothetical protein
MLSLLNVIAAASGLIRHLERSSCDVSHVWLGSTLLLACNGGRTLSLVCVSHTSLAEFCR